MAVQATTQNGKRGFFWSRWTQLFFYLAFGVVIPVAVVLLIAGSGSFWLFHFASSQVATYGSIAACLASWYILDRLRQYAKSQRLSYVGPVNLATFVTLAAVIGILRLPYSLVIIAATFGMTTAVSLIVTAFSRHSTQVQYLVPGGRIDEIEQKPGHRIKCSIKDLEELLASRHPTGFIVADLHHDHEPEWEKLMAHAALQGIPVYHYRQIMESITGQVRIEHLSENSLGSLIPNLPYMTIKRLIDLTAAILSLPIVLPLLLILAIAIKIDSRGKVFFIQDRMGFRGRPFRMVKFRTMRERSVTEDSEAARHDAMTQDNDDRITGIGRHLRKYRLDELPQIFNIIRGEMSWIGPRPEAIHLSDWYEESIPFYSYRHIVRPGITGWAQVNQGHVTDLDSINEKLRFDFYYIKNISHWLDLLITLKTVRVVLGGFGAR